MMDAWAKSDRKKSKARNPDHETTPNELYPTPSEATVGLLSVEKFEGRVWEPASGLGHISRVFESRGFDVVSSDLFADQYGFGEKADFLKTQRTCAPNIVTNSPFTLFRPFMQKAFTLPGVKKVAFLAPFEAIRVKSNVAIWREFGFPRVHLLVPTLIIDCGEKGMVKSVFSHCWYVWDLTRRAGNNPAPDHIDLRHLFWKDLPENGVGDLL